MHVLDVLEAHVDVLLTQRLPVDASCILAEILASGAWDRPEFKRRAHVT